VVVGWVLMDFPLDGQLIADMQRLAALDLTLLSRASSAEPWAVSLTSLDGVRAARLAGQPWLDDSGEAAMSQLRRAAARSSVCASARSASAARPTSAAACAPWSRSRSMKQCACRATCSSR
jgi:hypothetical protein